MEIIGLFLIVIGAWIVFKWDGTYKVSYYSKTCIICNIESKFQYKDPFIVCKQCGKKSICPHCKKCTNCTTFNF